MLFVLYTDFVAVMQTFYHLGNLAAVTGLQGLAAAAFPLFGIHDGDNCILGHSEIKVSACALFSG